MRDGKTRQTRRPAAGGRSAIDDRARRMAKLVVVTGREAGREFPIQRERITLGRGPGVDIALHDAAMSRQHAAISLTRDGLRVEDLGSTNGILVDGRAVQVGTLAHGSRLEVGGHVFQLVIEERAETPEAYELPVGV